MAEKRMGGQQHETSPQRPRQRHRSKSIHQRRRLPGAEQTHDMGISQRSKSRPTVACLPKSRQQPQHQGQQTRGMARLGAQHLRPHRGARALPSKDTEAHHTEHRHPRLPRKRGSRSSHTMTHKNKTTKKKWSSDRKAQFTIALLTGFLVWLFWLRMCPTAGQMILASLFAWSLPAGFLYFVGFFNRQEASV